MTNGKFLFEAVGMIDDEMIESAAEENAVKQTKLTFAQKWGAIAACLAVIAVINVVFVYRFWWNERDPGGCVTPGDSVTDADTNVESDMPDDGIAGMYAFTSCEEEQCIYSQLSPWMRHGGIDIRSDGTVDYIEPIWMNAVYPTGTWSADGDVITVCINDKEYRFRMENGDLVFIEETRAPIFFHLDPGEAFSKINFEFNDKDEYTLDDYLDRSYYRLADIELGGGVSIYSDGTCRYNPPMFSSVIPGPGTWTVEGDVITLCDENHTNHFRMKDGNLVFIEEGSTRFIYMPDLEDGEVFVRDEAAVPHTDVIANTRHCLCVQIDSDTGKKVPKHSITELYPDYFTAGSYDMDFYTSNEAFGNRYDMSGKSYGSDEREILESVTFLGKTYELTDDGIAFYSDISESERSMYDSVDSYRTSDGEQIYVRADGEVVFFHGFCEKGEELTVYGGECKKIADEYLKQLRGDKAQNYVVLNQMYDMMSEFYTVHYCYTIDGIYTTDVVKIQLKGDGDLYMFDGADMGRYDDVRMSSDLFGAYKKNLTSWIHAFVPNEYVSTSNLTDYMLCQYKDKYYLKATAESHFGGSHEESTVFYIEIVQ